MHSQIFEGAYLLFERKSEFIDSLDDFISISFKREMVFSCRLSMTHDKIKQTLPTSRKLFPMPAKDAFHELVKIALEIEGWTITHDPYHIDLGFVDFYIDLGAERLIAATKNGEKIAVEIKTFLSASTISEFHTAIGQFINYRIALEEEDADRKLYLAVPLDIYKRFFKYPFIQTVIRRNQIPLLVYNIEKQEVAQWIS